MSIKVGKLEVFIGPQPFGPDDLEAAIIDFIDGAQGRLEAAVQELDNERIARALIAAKVQRGVNVRIVLESDYLRNERPAAVIWNPAPGEGGKLEPNRLIHDAILRAAIRINTDYNPKIFHQKFIVRDRTELLTGSTNFTDTGVSKNLNHVVIVRDEKIAKTYAKEFKEITSGHFGQFVLDRDDTPTTSIVSGVSVRALFAPDHAPEMEVMKQMMKARRRVDFAMFTFAKSSGIDDAMIRLSQDAGIPIRGVLDRRQGNQDWAATRPLANAGASLRWPKSGTGIGKVHHKLMVIDDQVIIAGSFNYTGPANRFNDENIVVIGEIDASGQAAERQARLAGFVRAQIDDMFERLCEDVPAP